jgi:hypothetical protein
MAVGLCLIVGMGCRSGFVLDCGYGLPVVLWVCGGWNFCVMVVAPWVSDLLLAWGAGRRHGVWGCRHGVWSMGVAVFPCGLPACVVGEVWGKKNGCEPCGLPVFLVGKAWEKKIIF